MQKLHLLKIKIKKKMQRIRKKINQPLSMIKENKKVVKIKKMNLKKMSCNNNK